MLVMKILFFVLKCGEINVVKGFVFYNEMKMNVFIVIILWILIVIFFLKFFVLIDWFICIGNKIFGCLLYIWCSMWL